MWDPNLVVPFVVNKFKSNEIYVDTKWALKIEKVTADGKDVPAEDSSAKLDDLNFNKIPIGDAPFVYLVRRSALFFAETFTEKSKYVLKKYNIPETAKRIVIEYRLRESPDVVGPVMTLESQLTS